MLLKALKRKKKQASKASTMTTKAISNGTKSQAVAPREAKKATMKKLMVKKVKKKAKKRSTGMMIKISHMTKQMMMGLDADWL